jgi:hypothetical protein
MTKLPFNKGDKILLVLFDLSEGLKKILKFEDVVVALFKKFPNDFHLKGYKEYPDSGDSIKRRLYTFRDSGLLNVNNMLFSLTDKGLDYTQKIKKNVGKKELGGKENFDRYIEKEINRIKKLRSFTLFLNKDFQNILDTDFFDYLGISVRSERMDFKARLNFIKEVNKVISNEGVEPYLSINKFHYFMVDKFKDDINYKLTK